MVIDPTTLILTALGSGATVVQVKTNKAMEETYSKLKTLIRKKFLGNSEAMFVLDKYEEKPEVWEAPLKEELIQVNADEDKEIIQAAKTLISLQESQQKADYEQLAAEADHMRKQLQQTYVQHRHQSEQWLRFSLIAAVLGLLVIIGGVFALLAEKNPIGLLTVATSLIPEAAAALFSLRAKEAKKRADTIIKQLVQSERVYEAIELALMSDDETRKRLQGLIVERLLDLSGDREETPISYSTELLSA